MKYLFATIGELLEHSKTATTQLQEIPTLVNTVNKLRDEIKEDVANLSGRMLIVEEDVKKISSLVFTKDGNSIVKSKQRCFFTKMKGLVVSQRPVQFVSTLGRPYRIF